MTLPTAKPPPKPDAGFEFELTDLASAREALDDASIELAAEAARPADMADWSRRRRPPVPTDRALAGLTIDWMLGLPAALRPTHLADRYPRLANRVAEMWTDRQGCIDVLQRLLTDDRGGRRGLPADVCRELQSLRAHLETSHR